MERRGGRGANDTTLTLTGLTVVTLTSVASAYRAAAAGDVGSAAFVGISYAMLLLLFFRLRAYDRLPPPPPRQLAADDDEEEGRRRRHRVKREVWVLCTLLTVMFAWKVAAVMPSWPVKAVVWAMAVVTAVAGFIALFCHP